ncbi:hypothetical protein [Paenibacillus sp. HB172176]|uniref:hypothetical protein n=1 Tax=Paenibacillus sp. HB172176 TaxID=2493690 RepID=UPI0014394BFF|nr:hypothetical protein [Paenibacillus sp. HB172176]
MDKNGKKRRGYALPITLLLLVMSLTCNILLLTKNVQHTRDEAVERGKAIYDYFAESVRQADEMQVYLREIITLNGEKEGSAARLTATHAGKAAQPERMSLYQLMTAASEQEPGRFEGAPEEAEGYWQNRIVASLLAIAAGTGELTEEELTKLSAMEEELTALKAVLAKFDYDIGDDRSSLIQLSNGLNWLDIAAELQDELTQTSTN